MWTFLMPLGTVTVILHTGSFGAFYKELSSTLTKNAYILELEKTAGSRLFSKPKSSFFEIMSN